MLWGSLPSCVAVGNRHAGRLAIGPQVANLPHTKQAHSNIFCFRDLDRPGGLFYAAALGSLGSDRGKEMLETRDFLGSVRFFEVRRASEV